MSEEKKPIDWDKMREEVLATFGDKICRTYKMRFTCFNCGHKCEQDIERGTMARRADCPNCGCFCLTPANN
jgi:hypothetical protein